MAPTVELGSFECTFDLIGKYVDLNNTANQSAQRETGNHIGLGTGLTMRLGKLYFRLDFTEMRARHFFLWEIKMNTWNMNTELQQLLLVLIIRLIMS